jgi:hypothetical protein
MPVDVDVLGDLHLLRIAGLSAVRLEPRRQRKVFSIDGSNASVLFRSALENRADMDSQKWEDLHKRRAFCGGEVVYEQAVSGEVPNLAYSDYRIEGIEDRRNQQRKSMMYGTTPCHQEAARTRNRAKLVP